MVAGGTMTHAAPTDLAAWIKANRGLILYWVKRRPCPSVYEAEDAFQAATIGVMRAAKEFDPSRGCHFNTLVAWKIRGEIRNEAVKVLRKLKRERHSPRLMPNIPLGTFDDWLKTIPDGSERLPRAISRLTEREQQVIRLRYYEGMNGPAISEALGVSKQRVGQLEER